ncbi:hypothetical protein D3C85_1012770 [compost metagenome]
MSCCAMFIKDGIYNSLFSVNITCFYFRVAFTLKIIYMKTQYIAIFYSVGYGVGVQTLLKDFFGS